MSRGNTFDPVCGMAVSENSPFKSVYNHSTIHFCCERCKQKFDAEPEKFLAPAGGAATGTGSDAPERDPVCGMTVSKNSPFRSVYNHSTIHFCCERCKQKFDAEPEKFSTAAPGSPTGTETPPPPGAKIVYICPMDPEVEEPRPGPCPVCGMALEKKFIGFPAGGEIPDDDRELFIRMRRKLIISALLTVILMLTGCLPHWFDFPTGPVMGVLQLIVSSLVIFGPARFLIVLGLQSLRKLSFNMFTLILLGIGVAWLYSLYALFFSSTLPETMLYSDGRPHLYFEPAAMIATLITLGQMLEARARSKTGGAIRSLLKLAPPTATLVKPDGSTAEIPLEKIQVGDIVRIKPGARIPVDGVVISGGSDVDEAMLTGEPAAVLKEVGDQVSAGTLNGRGAFDMTARKVGSDTLLARIIALVGEAQSSRAPIQNLVDRVAAIFVPVVVTVALLAFLIWTFGAGDFRFGLTAAIAVLLVACPCALGLATPMSIVVGTGLGARNGILIRNAEAMEKMKRVDVVVFDKTGTLTAGKPAVTAIRPVAGVSPERVLALGAAGESYSEHPLARAVVSEAQKRQLVLPPGTDFRNHPGQGISFTCDGSRALVGSAAFMASEQIDLRELEHADAETRIYAAHAGQLLGVLVISDPVKPDSAAAVAALKSEGIEPVLLTGDNRATAEAVAREVGIDNIIAEALPDQKFAAIRELQSQGRIVAMAGDGINDAAALAQADVGIAMGTGTDIAMQSAGITLVSGNLDGVVKAVRLSREMARNIRQNLFFAFIYNIVMIPLAAGVLYPAFGWFLHPVIGSFMMSLSSVSVITNALRLRRRKLD